MENNNPEVKDLNLKEYKPNANKNSEKRFYGRFIKMIPRKKKIWLLLILFTSLGLTVWGLIDGLNHGKSLLSGDDFFSLIVDPFLAMFTGLVAILILLNDYRREWEDNLPKRLTVHCKQGKNYILTCHKAFLAGESDIRQWAQQIAKQMNEEEYLKFYPFFKNERPQLMLNENNLLIKHYETTIFLDEDYDFRITRKRKDDEEKTHTILKTHYLIWFENENNTAHNEEIKIEGHVLKPLIYMS